MPSQKEVPGLVCLRLKEQEIPYDDPHSRFMFTKPFVVTQAAHRTFGPVVLLACLQRIQAKAQRLAGLDYLQAYENLSKRDFDGRNLWFIEDDAVVTALLPEDY